MNSFKIASTVTIICIVIGSLAAYALVRIPFKLNRTIQLGILGTRMIPEVSLVMPLFIIAARLELINKPIVLIITYLSFALPYSIWMMAAYFQICPDRAGGSRPPGWLHPPGDHVPRGDAHLRPRPDLHGHVRLPAGLG